MPTLYITIGPAGSGKSTLAEKMVAEGKAIAYIEADHYMLDLNGRYRFDPKNLGFAHQRCKTRCEEIMAHGTDSLIQSNTNLRRKDVDTYLELAKQYGYDVVLIKMKTQFKSIHNVPDDKVASMKDLAERFDYSNLPDFVRVEEYPELEYDPVDYMS